MALTAAPQIPVDKVEWRVDGKPNQGKTQVRFVPYIDARDAMDLLDEWVGPGRWSDEFRETAIDGKHAVVCTLRIKVDDEWVAKSDVGVPSNFEPQKGAFSDAFKRACTKWGVARNVYELPTLWAPCRVDDRGKAWPNDQSLPAILRQLKAQGVEASGGRVQQQTADADQDERDEPAGEPPRGGPPVCIRCRQPIVGPAERTDGGRVHKGDCPGAAA